MSIKDAYGLEEVKVSLRVHQSDELRSHLRVRKLVAYLLAVKYDPFLLSRYRNRLVRAIQNHRKSLKVAGNGTSFDLGKIIAKEYPKSIRIASEIMCRRPAVLPQKCPFRTQQIMRENFLPRAKYIPLVAYQVRTGDDLITDWSEAGFHVTRLEEVARDLFPWALENVISNEICAVAIASGSRKPLSLRGGVLVSVEANPRLLFGSYMPPKKFAIVRQWVRKNRTALRQHWNYQIDSIELYRKTKSGGQ